MLTKKDLTVLNTMFRDAKKEITEQVTLQVTEQVTSQVFSKVRDLLQRNTDHLVELITTGFNIQDAGFDKTDKSLSNHEKRIGALEKTIFKTN